MVTLHPLSAVLSCENLWHKAAKILPCGIKKAICISLHGLLEFACTFGVSVSLPADSQGTCGY